MNNIQKRFMAFFLLCISARLFLAYIANKASDKNLKLMGYIMLIPAIGIFHIYIYRNKAVDAQLKWAGEEKVWWNQYRPLHGLIYFTFAIMAIQNNRHSWKAFAGDALLGSVLFLHNQYDKGTMNQLFINK